LTWAVETDALTKCFPKSTGWRGLVSPAGLSFPAVDRVSIQIRQGELFGLLGVNGAGKTTLIKMLSTLIEPTSGSARVNGYDLNHDAAIKNSIGLVTSDERSFYWRLSGQQNLEFFASLYGLPPAKLHDRVEHVLEQVELQETAEDRFLTYSTGTRQRLSFARALLNEPKLLFLDEPTKGIDPLVAHRLQNLIREDLVERQGMTVLLTTHDLREAEQLCDRIAIIHNGQIQAVGSLDDLRQSFDLGQCYIIQVKGLTDRTRLLLAEQLPGLEIETNATAADGQKNDILLSGAGDEPALNQAIDLLRAEGTAILSASSSQTSLEEIFSYHAQQPGVARPIADRTSARAGEQPSTIFSAARTGSIPFQRVLPAFLRRDFIQEASYRLAFLLQFFNIFFSVLIFYFISELLGDAAAPYLTEYGGDYFSFVLIGIAFLGYFSTGLSSFASSLRHSQTTGTLEAMLTTPTSLSAIILASSWWDYLVTTVRVLVYLAVGVLLLRADIQNGNYPAALLIIVLTVVTASSLGIIAASFIMVTKRGDPIQWGVSALNGLLGGVYYPVAILPAGLAWLARLLPITYSLHAMRLALLNGASWSQLAPDILALVIFSIVLLPLSLTVFRYAVHRAKVEGSLTHY
jgi:ABC-2 type transport system permease protein